MLVLQLEDVIRERREASYARLLEFLAIDDEPAMRRYFDAEVIPANARMNRWREQVPAAERDAFEARYREIVVELLERDVAGVRPLEDSLRQ